MSQKKLRLFFAVTFLCFLTLAFSSCTNPLFEQVLGLKTITFNTNGGSHVPEQKLFKGEKITRPKDPVMASYLFLDWYLDNEMFETEWDFNIVPDGDMILYAKWRSIGLELTPSFIGFGSRNYGYGPIFETVNVKNIFEQTISNLTVVLSGSNADSFGLTLAGFIEELEPDEITSFLIYPNIDLPIGSYTAIVTVSNGDDISVSANVSFTVTAFPIDAVELEIHEPMTGRAPSTILDINYLGNYTIESVAWTPINNPFLPDIVYAVSVMLRAEDNYTFAGLLFDNATINGSPAVVSNNTGATVRLSYTFAKTLAKEVDYLLDITPPLLIHGDRFDESGQEIMIRYTDGTSESVSAVNFAERNITITVGGAPIPADTIMRRNLHNNGALVISYGGKTVECGDLNIAQKALLITGVTHTRPYSGQFLVTEDNVVVNFTGKIDDNEEVSIQITGANYTNQNAGTDKTMNISGASLVGEHSGNYFLSSFTNPLPVTGGITKAPGASINATEININEFSSTGTSIVLNFFLLQFQEIEYAISSSNNATNLTWQPSSTFSGLSTGITYYVYARSKEDNNYSAGNPSVSTAIHSITFNANGGTPEPAHQFVHINHNLFEPLTDPERDGYDFDGWYTDTALANKWNFNNQVTGNMTLYAKWLGDPSFTITLEQITDLAPNITGPTVSLSDEFNWPLIAPDAYSYSWRIRGEEVSNLPQINISNVFLSENNIDGIGVQSITLEIRLTENGPLYSKVILITVEE